MAVLTKELVLKSLNTPDEIRELPKTRVHVVTIGDYTVSRVRFEPGWKWSESMKPIAGTELCEYPHLAYFISGRMHIRMGDGTKIETKPGDLVEIPPGHDGWVIGNEPVVTIDFVGGKDYGK